MARNLPRRAFRSKSGEVEAPGETPAYDTRGGKMMQTREVRPDLAGVVYSPGGEGWRFYPEERLFVGRTGTDAYMTNVRTFLRFPRPDDPDSFLIRATLRLRILANDPPGEPKSVCLREAPGEEHWTLAAELAKPVWAERRLTTETNQDLDFDLTGLVAGWTRAAMNRGIVLDFGFPTIGLVTFGNGSDREPGPSLRYERIKLASAGRKISLEADPGMTVDSEEMPYGGLLVKNEGPGQASFIALYRFARARPLDPTGQPPGILQAGEFQVIKPQFPARGLRLRIEADKPGTILSLYPVSAEA